MSGNIQRFIDQAKNGISTIKSALNNENYSTVEEIKQINLEINQINQRMQENQQKALRETDPVKKLALIAAIEEDGKLLIQKQNKLAQMENRLNFNANGYVNDMIKAMKEAIMGNSTGNSSGGSGGGSGSRNNNNQSRPPRNPTQSTNTNPNGANSSASGSGNNQSNYQTENQGSSNNQQLFLIIGA